ncbi:hypothetical protein K7432_013507 [Basidiobolus ranarum]|uniref:Metallo-beta-lactamase domain-containing protein n=1 Tax=Basidiobolus ranarum TaxID=34480 RepID=A0ABR2VQP8_9FUNG
MRFLVLSLPILCLLGSYVEAHGDNSGHKLKIYHYSSPENALSSVSTLIVGKKEAMVVDPPFLNSAARGLISFIKKKTNLPVTKIFSTHEHPDHFFGGTELLKVFRKADLLASPGVVKKINQVAQSKVDQWTPVYGAKEIPQSPSLPKPYKRTIIQLKGNYKEPIHLLQPLQGDVDDLTVLWIPTQKTVITGDMVYAGNNHVWLAEAQTPIARDNWISSLTFLQSLKPRRVIGGHVPNGVQPSVSDLQATKDYISYFNKEIFGRKLSENEIYSKMAAKFPTRQLVIALNITAQTYGYKSN